MKWTTANVKHPNYDGNHEIFVGTHTGSFKKIVPAYEQNPFVQKNLQELSKLEKDSRITALEYSDAACSEIIIGRARPNVELYSLRTEQLQHTKEFQSAPVVGAARYGEQLIAGFSNGHVQCVDLSKSAGADLLFKAGDHMSHLRQCSAARNLVATGGKGRQNNLKVFDLAADGKQIFTTKNLPNDYLQLEVPVWDSDVGFIDGPHTLASCSRHGYVRVYDTRKQRRPVQHFATEEQMSFTTLTAHGNYIYTGTTMGALKAFDIRRLKTFVHTYKGFTGGISDLHLDASGKYLTSASLDRYVRVHDADSTVLLYQCYVKSKATCVLIREPQEDISGREENADDSENAKAKKSSKKQKQVPSQQPVDEEYEDMFDNMQTICDNKDDGTAAADDADSSAEEPVTKAEPKASKRKAQSAARKMKKKKN